MSIHRSLVSQGKLARHRNVLSRAERLQTLLEGERWRAGDSPFGLPKVRSIKHKVKKAKKTAETAGAAAPAEAGKAAAAKPAAGAKGPATAKPAAEKKPGVKK